MIYCFICRQFARDCPGHGLKAPPEFVEAMQKVAKTWGRLLFDDANRRSPFAEMVGRLSDEELAKLGLERVPLRTPEP